MVPVGRLSPSDGVGRQPIAVGWPLLLYLCFVYVKIVNISMNIAMITMIK